MAVCASIRGTPRKPLKQTTKAAKPAAKRKSASAAARDSAVATSNATSEIIDVHTEVETESTAAVEKAGASDAARPAGGSSEAGDMGNENNGDDARKVWNHSTQLLSSSEESDGAALWEPSKMVDNTVEDENEQAGSDAGNSQPDATRENLQRSLGPLPDRCPSGSSYWRDLESAAASLAPGEKPAQTEEPRLGEDLASVSQAEVGSSVSSVLDELPPGSEAGLSQTTASDFNPKSATRSEAPTKSSGNVEEINPLCTKCGYPTDVLKSVLKTKASAAQHAKYVCRPCNAIQTMVFRKIRQEGPLKLSDWDDAQIEDFYRRAKESHEQNGGRMKWKVVRDCMKKTMVKRVTEATEAKMKAEYKPLGVWERLGYDVEMIAAYNRTNSPKNSRVMYYFVGTALATFGGYSRV